MRTSPTPSSRTARTAVEARDRLRVAPAGRRSLPWVLAGLLLVVVCALAFAVASSRLGQRQAVLAIAHTVPAGHVVDQRDLAVVRVSLDPGLRPIAASAQATVVGRPAAVPLLPGTLLTEAALGPPSALRAGEGVVGLALKPGQFPPGLAAGARVLAAETSPDADTAVAATGSSPRTYRAVVVGITEPAAEGAAAEAGEAVVSLKLAAADAPRVAAAGAAGRVVLVLVASEGS